MRIMGLDYGSKTVGVAVCDPLGITAQAVETITRKDENKLRQTLARIEALAKEYGVEKFVLGYPKNMNNTVGDRAQKSEELKAALERRTGLPVELWDERLTQKRVGRPDRSSNDPSGIFRSSVHDEKRRRREQWISQ